LNSCSCGPFLLTCCFPGQGGEKGSPKSPPRTSLGSFDPRVTGLKIITFVLHPLCGRLLANALRGSLLLGVIWHGIRGDDRLGHLLHRDAAIHRGSLNP